VISTLHSSIYILLPLPSKGSHVCSQHVDDYCNKMTLIHPSAVVGIFFNCELNTACRRGLHPVHAITYFKILSILSSHLGLGLASGLFPSGFHTKSLHSLLFSIMPLQSYPYRFDHPHYTCCEGNLEELQRKTELQGYEDFLRLLRSEHRPEQCTLNLGIRFRVVCSII